MLKPGKPASKLTKSDSRTGSELDDLISCSAILQSDYNIFKEVTVLVQCKSHEIIL
jgi:hypothetical protein